MRVKEPGPEKPAPRLRDLRGDNRLEVACAGYVDARRRADEAGAQADAFKREILERVGERGARAAGHLVTVERAAAVPERTITAEMVGKVISGRAGSLRLKVVALPAAAPAERGESREPPGFAITRAA